MGKSTLVAAAVTLFAERGFAGTSIADVQAAAGLNPGSGALYKHFSSKEELFEACLHWVIEDYERGLTESHALVVADLEQTLWNVGRAALDRLGAQRFLFRLLFRDAERFPETVRLFRERGTERVLEQFAAWLESIIDTGAGIDARALSVVLIGSLVNYRMTETLLGVAPGPVPEDAFLRAWVGCALAVLRPADAGE